MKPIRCLILGFAFLSSPAFATDWMERTRDACARAGHNAVECGNALRLVRDAVAAAPTDGASSAVAAYVVLERLYPDQQPEFENRLAIVLAGIPESQAKAEACESGRATGIQILARESAITFAAAPAPAR